MNWIALNNIDQLDIISQESKENPVVIYKHSTSCSTSRISLDRLNRNYKPEEFAGIKTYYLDLLTYRNISNAIANKFDVVHESPQAIVIKDGRAIYSVSHFDIDYKVLKGQVS
jgi:bacillithiol system protein YtxJ